MPALASGNKACSARLNLAQLPSPKAADLPAGVVQFGRKPLFIGGSIVMASMFAIIAAVLGAQHLIALIPVSALR